MPPLPKHLSPALCSTAPFLSWPLPPRATPALALLQWIILDGIIDAEWIESMNTVMDDNKMLTLASNERIPLTNSMRMVFEISHLRNATPATVSRAGIIYMNETDVGWGPFQVCVRLLCPPPEGGVGQEGAIVSNPLLQGTGSWKSFVHVSTHMHGGRGGALCPYGRRSLSTEQMLHIGLLSQVGDSSSSRVCETCPCPLPPFGLAAFVRRLYETRDIFRSSWWEARVQQGDTDQRRGSYPVQSHYYRTRRGMDSACN